VEVHKLRIDTLSEASLRGDVDDHDALESFGDFPESLVEVPVDVTHRDVVKRLEL
jgi:hypothetical protein